MSGNKRVWAQSCGHNHVWAQLVVPFQVSCQVEVFILNKKNCKIPDSEF